MYYVLPGTAVYCCSKLYILWSKTTCRLLLLLLLLLCTYYCCVYVLLLCTAVVVDFISSYPILQGNRRVRCNALDYLNRLPPTILHHPSTIWMTFKKWKLGGMNMKYVYIFIYIYITTNCGYCWCRWVERTVECEDNNNNVLPAPCPLLAYILRGHIRLYPLVRWR